MADPRNNNPFETDTARETRSEADANRLLANTVDPDDAVQAWASNARDIPNLSAFDRGYIAGASAMSTCYYIEPETAAERMARMFDSIKD